MKVSLIIATYNDPAALRKVVDGVLRQIRFPDELIIAEDGMDDATASLVSDIAGTAPFPVYHVRQEHKEFRAAKIRNEAIKRSSGDYIVLLDGDCIVNRHFIEDHVDLAEKGYIIQGKRVHVNRNAVEQFDYCHADSTSSLMSMALSRGISNVHHIVRMPFCRPSKTRSSRASSRVT